MTHTISDLRSRTLVESNTLKSLILSSAHPSELSRDNVLIHDFQMANSITLNSIISNFTGELKYAWERMGNVQKTSDSYFQIVSSVDLASDDAKTILCVKDDGSTEIKS